MIRFFLFISILQFFPKFATISPGAVILPLIIVLAVTALKDAYEDYKRHESDKRVNKSKVFVLSGGNWSNPNFTEKKSRSFLSVILPKRSKSPAISAPSLENDPKEAARVGIQYDYKDDTPNSSNETIKPHWKRTSWEDLRVGDFVKIMDNESFPADILICSTSEEENVAFVETKNLDGETNLKSRRGVPALSVFNSARACTDSQNSFFVRCDRPDTDMYRLNANVTTNGSTSPVDLSMTLLRGTVLKNTGWAIGVVLFTGLDTKIVMNSGGTPSKRSKVERLMNPQVYV